MPYLCNPVSPSTGFNAEIAQLVEHDLAKVGVASSSLVFRSKKTPALVRALKKVPNQKASDN